MLDASSGGVLLSKSYEERYRLIESITANTYQWPISRANVSTPQKRPAGVHKVTETTALATQVAQIHQMMKNLMTQDTPKPEPVKVVTNASEVTCVYYGGAHLFEECTANPVSAKYVGNNRYNNPYSNTYNPGWRNLPNFSWSNSQVLITRSEYQKPREPNAEIATTLSSRPQRALPSSTKAPTTYRVKNVVTCKVIKLRNGKECETPPRKETEASGALPDKDNTKERDVSVREPTSVENDKERRVEINHGKTPKSSKKPEDLAQSGNDKKFVQERPPPPFPQRIRKAKEEQQFGKFMEILKQLHINVPLIEV
ncbi:uncharacterized protein LOC131614323 [Vicia villosa]|uniref:uncharacterized protein LOC131614323 n=1 Tax=Vicia villosa TaxID=3911 RepID=UPI00273AA37C|nr:uncharacterized protein LOC131614323 [Vicia villosa]